MLKERQFTPAELKVIRITLIMEWEVKQGIEWTVDGVNIHKLVEQIENILDQNDPNS